MGKTAPPLKAYKMQEDSPYVAHARTLMEQGFKGVNEMMPKINTMDEGTQADINSRLGAIYNRAKNDFDINYRDTMGTTMANQYGQFGTTGATPSLYRNDMTNRTAQRELADLAYNKAQNYETNVNNELNRRYNTLSAYNNLYGYGEIPQQYDDQNYKLGLTNQDRAYQNDLARWNTEQSMIGTGTNVGVDALGLALAPFTGGASLLVSQALKPTVTGLVAPNAKNYSTGVSSKDWGNIIGGTKAGRGWLEDNQGLGKGFNTSSNGGIMDNVNMGNQDIMELLRQLFGGSFNTSGTGGYTGNLGGMA
jgi:hypothetical protein